MTWKGRCAPAAACISAAVLFASLPPADAAADADVIVMFREGLPPDLNATLAANGAVLVVADDDLDFATARAADPGRFMDAMRARADVEHAYPVRTLSLFAEASLCRIVIVSGSSTVSGSDASLPTCQYQPPPPPPPPPTTMANDPYYSSTCGPLACQWAHHHVNGSGAWTALGGFGSPGIVVALLDTGVDSTHPEFSGRLVRVGLSPGINVVSKGLPPEDEHGHGTAMAGIIGAAIHNGAGIAGLSRAMILNIKVCNPACRSDDVAIGIALAANQGADVISMSIGTTYEPLLERATNYSALRDVLMVAAAGNVPNRPISWPAALPHVMAVGAVNVTNLSKGSASGPDMELVAPGGDRTQDYRDIFTTLPGGYGYAAATSVAAAHVAGGAASAWSAHPALSASEMRAILKETARPLTLLPDGTSAPVPNAHYGYGLLDVGAAVSRIQA